MRTQLITVPGAVVPYPFGGKQRQVTINLNPQLMQSKGVSTTDVLTAVSAQNVVVPSGTAKIDQFEYDVRQNAAPKTGCASAEQPPSLQRDHYRTTSVPSATDLLRKRTSSGKTASAAF